MRWRGFQLKVYLQPSDRFGCGHYRMFYPLAELQKTDLDIQLVEDRVDPGDQVVVVFQRPWDRDIATETIPYLQSRGYAVVVELDDHLSKIQPDHCAYIPHHPRFNPQSNYKWLEECCRQADLVITTTQKLNDFYAPHGRGVVIPNFLPAGFCVDQVRTEPQDKYRMGWAGQVDTHPGDLDIAARGIRRALQDPNWTFLALGFDTTLKALGVKGEVREWVPIDKYARALRDFDLGVVPLRLNEFNHGKSYLKGLEYAGAGVPFVASPSEPYTGLHNAGAGLLAETSKDWQRLLTTLVAEPSMRYELASRGLRYAKTQTYELNAWRWAEAYALARENYESRRMSPAAREMALHHHLTIQGDR